jgi:hypothetical protein
MPPKDEAGPLWLIFENAMNSLPVRPWIVALMLVSLAATVLLVVTIRRKSKIPPS